MQQCISSFPALSASPGQAMHKRVVVTGIGSITPIGSGPGLTSIRAGLRAGKSAVRTITSFDTSQFCTHIAATVENFDLEPYLDGKKLKRLDKFSQFAVAASKMAVSDSGLDLADEDRDRIGVCLGTALGGVGFAEQQYPAFLQKGPRGVNPMLALSVFNGAGSCNIAIELGITGPATANGDSCASSPIAIGHAVDFIRDGTADIMLAGGSEAPLSLLCYGAFAIIRAMSQRNEDPGGASRPFDKDRDGFVMAEGASMLVLEERERALARRATIYGEIVSHAITNDAFHMTQPLPGGDQAARCIRECLRKGAIRPEQISSINAHASSTPLNDSTETAAIKKAFGEYAHQIPITASKGYHGHALGATGAWEAVISLLSLTDQWLPPTINLINTDPACDLDIVREPEGRHVPINYVLSNSFGFGGINACLIFKKHD